MKKRIGLFILIAALVGGVFFIYMSNGTQPSTDQFIKHHFVEGNGAIRTYIKSEEYLTESTGLYLQFLLKTGQKEEFQRQVAIVQDLSDEGFLKWRRRDAHSNASVDDLRIMTSLYRGAEKWKEDYAETAGKIQTFIEDHQITENLIVDFYDRKSRQASREVHLSYIDAEALTYFDDAVTEAHAGVLGKAGGDTFFPEVYVVEEETFTYQKEVNLIDQSLIARNASKLGVQTDHFFEFLEQEMEEEGKVYGRYDRSTKEPTVPYESPSAYAILTLTFIEKGDENGARAFYERMLELRSEDGGYKMDQDNAHFFDNILPAIAEEVYENKE